jgi:DMSO reductase anchor subunit
MARPTSGQPMLAKYILGTLAIAFLIAALTRGPRSPQGRTWLLIAAIFGIVSSWLFAKG